MVLRQVAIAALLTTFVAIVSRDARAEAPCFSAFTRGQQAAASGKVLEARAQFMTCLADTTCPAPPLLKDCATQLDAVNVRMGSIVVSLSNGATAARITVDGLKVASAIDGKAIELDPGTHHVVVSRDRASDVTLDVLVIEGVKLKQVIVDVPTPQVFVQVPPLQEAKKKPRYAAWVVGAVGLSLGAAFGVLAGAGQITYDGCQSSACSSGTMNTLRIERAVAWTFFGVGVAALVASGVLFAVKF